MAKAPIAGLSKTRLTPRLSHDEAAELSACFIRDAVALAERAAGARAVVAISPTDAGPAFDELLPGCPQIVQRGAQLGDRLAHVMSRALDDGFDQVVAINADGPTLPVRLIDDAFRALGAPETDIVLGPTDDGGYYLIGWTHSHPAVVEEVEMSTPTVLDDTLAIAERDGLTVDVLDPWYDVDDGDDLDRLIADIERGVPCGEHTIAFLGR